MKKEGIDLPENKDLIQAKKGDTKAFDKLIFPIIEPLFKTMYLMTGDRSAAEDIVQETMYQTFIHIKRFDPKKASLNTWMKKIAINQASKMNRKLVKNEIYEEETWIDKGRDYIANEEDYVFEELSYLSESVRIVMVLFYYEENSIKEIAEIIGISEGTVKSRLNTGRENLKQRLERRKEREE